MSTTIAIHKSLNCTAQLSLFIWNNKRVITDVSFFFDMILSWLSRHAFFRCMRYAQTNNNGYPMLFGSHRIPRNNMYWKRQKNKRNQVQKPNSRLLSSIWIEILFSQRIGLIHLTKHALLWWKEKCSRFDRKHLIEMESESAPVKYSTISLLNEDMKTWTCEIWWWR